METNLPRTTGTQSDAFDDSIRRLALNIQRLDQIASNLRASAESLRRTAAALRSLAARNMPQK